MKISEIGTGYVGLVTGRCLAQTGNVILCKDMAKNKITQILLLGFSKSLYLS